MTTPSANPLVTTPDLPRMVRNRVTLSFLLKNDVLGQLCRKEEKAGGQKAEKSEGGAGSNKCPPSRGAKAFLITLLPLERGETKSALITFSYNFIGRLSPLRAATASKLDRFLNAPGRVIGSHSRKLTVKSDICRVGAHRGPPQRVSDRST